ncbi:extracellular solute-binding protein [Oxalobacteraceae bacterium CAVE-383]|nr:extracellular solute-binding protein [Oxalobacteraceae bacterium CAVE-383]
MTFAAASLAAFACNICNAQAQTLQTLATATDEGRQQRLVEGAKKEGSLTLYTTTPAEYVSLLTEPFEKKYGIKVNIWRARSELILQRVLNETRANKAVSDVIDSIAPPMEALRRENVLQEVISPYQKDLIPTAAPKHHQWVSTLQYVFAQAYNTNKIKKEDLPRTYQDLLDPKWKGKLGIEGSDHEWMSSVIADMGETAGVKFFKDLTAGNGLSVRAGHPLLTNLVASGEVPLALTVYQYSAAQAKAKGAPIDWFVIEPAVTIADAMAIPKNAPHPNAALLFYDYMISPEAQAILAKIGYYATNRKVEPPIKNIKLKVLDPGTLLDNEEKSFKRFESILQLTH